MDDQQRLSRLARYVASIIPNGATIGLGSGSTAEAVVRAVGARAEAGLEVSGVPTSTRTAEAASSCGIKLLDFDQVESLDLGIDGADEISPQLDLVKGRGGALLHEKLVARTCKRLLIVAASEKLVEQLGTRFPLPVEVVPFGWRVTAECLLKNGIVAELRVSANGSPFVTDGGHYILDCATGPITDPGRLARKLKSITGVVDHGLFIDMASEAIVVDESGKLMLVTRDDRWLIDFD